MQPFFSDSKNFAWLIAVMAPYGAGAGMGAKNLLSACTVCLDGIFVLLYCHGCRNNVSFKKGSKMGQGRTCRSGNWNVVHCPCADHRTGLGKTDLGTRMDLGAETHNYARSFPDLHRVFYDEVIQ